MAKVSKILLRLRKSGVYENKNQKKDKNWLRHVVFTGFGSIWLFNFCAFN
jgi:hypothetical protein